jgi:prolyl-tRNA synthetase
MRQSHLFTKTLKEISREESSINAQLLQRAGFIDKLVAGVYSYLPLGYIVLNKIKNIIREEMDSLGAQEIYMPALTPKENWMITGRWKEIDVLFKLIGAGKKEYALGSTHEEIVTPLLKKFVGSYKDLPVAVYQIQDKFRDEARAKSGLLRGREFSMKDLYSFHANEEDLGDYYEKVKETYLKIFKRCGLDALVVEASGGVFSKFSHEFQIITQYGEDTIYYCSTCQRHQNKEIIQDKKCPYCQNERVEKKTIEVGNIFKLKTRFSKPFNFTYTTKDGKKELIQMGCYGIGPSRVICAIVEIYHDANGIIWPTEITPYQIHLINLNKNCVQSDEAYKALQKSGYTVLYDDRIESAGVKFKDTDLIGIPVRLVISEKTKDKIELKLRSSKDSELLTLKEVIEKCSKIF